MKKIQVYCSTYLILFFQFYLVFFLFEAIEVRIQVIEIVLYSLTEYIVFLVVPVYSKVSKTCLLITDCQHLVQFLINFYA